MPAGRIEPSAPPHRDIVMVDGKPSIGSDKINFMLFLKATEEYIKAHAGDYAGALEFALSAGRGSFGSTGDKTRLLWLSY